MKFNVCHRAIGTVAGEPAQGEATLWRVLMLQGQPLDSPRSEAPLLPLLSKPSFSAALTPELDLCFQKACPLLPASPEARPWEGPVASRLPECISECTCCPQTFLFKSVKTPPPPS